MTRTDYNQRHTDEQAGLAEARNLARFGLRYVETTQDAPAIIPVTNAPQEPTLSRSEREEQWREYYKSLPPCTDAELDEWRAKNGFTRHTNPTPYAHV